MSTTPRNVAEQIFNGSGGKLHTKAGTRRMSVASLTLCGVDLQVQYTAEGGYMPATETDPAELPMCVVRVIEIGGVDVTALLESKHDEIAELIEQQWALA
jgi:hypothetical protein